MRTKEQTKEQTTYTSKIAEALREHLDDKLRELSGGTLRGQEAYDALKASAREVLEKFSAEEVLDYLAGYIAVQCLQGMEARSEMVSHLSRLEPLLQMLAKEHGSVDEILRDGHRG